MAITSTIQNRVVNMSRVSLDYVVTSLAARSVATSLAIAINLGLIIGLACAVLAFAALEEQKLECH